MSQKNRIARFVEGRFHQMELRGQDAAFVFGIGAETREVEGFQNEYKCQNADGGACATNFRKCTNVQGRCRASTNAFECTNKLVE